MIKILKKINKFCEGVSILLVPLIIFYWFLNIIDLPALKSITALFEYFLNPLLFIVKSFGNFQVNYDSRLIDLNPLILAMSLFLIFFSFSGIEKILTAVEENLENAKIKVRQHQDMKLKETLKEKYLKDLAKNRIVYLVLKMTKKSTPSSYLFKQDEEDFFSGGMLNKMLSRILDGAEEFHGKKFKDFEGENEVYKYIFYDITEAIDFSFHVHNTIKDINKEVLDLSERMNFTIAAYCSVSEDTAEKDYPIVTKILGLGGANEILVSELFKSKYEALKDETNIFFESHGIYAIEDHQLEIYKIKVKPE